MKKNLLPLLLFSVFISCAKKETPAVEKTYTVQYKIEMTAVANTVLTGTATYVSKSSIAATTNLATPGWTFTESNWALKSGDRIGFSTTISNLAAYKAFLIIDGGVKTYNAESSTAPLNGKIDLHYVMP